MKTKILSFLLCCVCGLTASARVADKKVPLDSLDARGLIAEWVNTRP